MQAGFPASDYRLKFALKSRSVVLGITRDEVEGDICRFFQELGSPYD